MHRIRWALVALTAALAAAIALPAAADTARVIRGG